MVNKRYEVRYRITGKATAEVFASSPEEAMKKAKAYAVLSPELDEWDLDEVYRILPLED